MKPEKKDETKIRITEYTAIEDDSLNVRVWIDPINDSITIENSSEEQVVLTKDEAKYVVVMMDRLLNS